jgi:ribosome assembly protein YihI (activator of Der GTPase)
MLIRALICGKPATIILENDEQFQSLKNRLGDRFQYESINLVDISRDEIDALVFKRGFSKKDMSPVSEEERSSSDSDDDSV